MGIFLHVKFCTCRAHALLDQLRKGDATVASKYNRLARSSRDLLDIVEAIQGRDGEFQSLAEDIDITNSAGSPSASLPQLPSSSAS
jgi:DNA invertase Pin-like site-specific DNA recombinase